MGPSCRDPKTGLQGSQHAKKCWKAFYRAPRGHTITMGPYLGVHEAPRVRQNQKYSKFHPDQAKMPYQMRAPAGAAFFCDPETRLRGSLRATKRWDASYNVPRHHTITMGPQLGVPRALWGRQNQKNREFHPFLDPRKQKHKFLP